MADILLNSIESGSGGGLIMPIRVASGIRFSLKDGTASFFSSEQSGFYSLIENFFISFGKKFDVTTSSLNSGTAEQTIVDITGEGVLTNVLSPWSNQAYATITITVTIDGNEHVFSSTPPTSGDKMIIGDVIEGGIDTTDSSISVGGSYDVGFQASTSNSFGIMTPEQVLQRRLCGMVFKESLKVTIQNNLGFSSGGANNKACVFYTTYIPEGLK